MADDGGGGGVALMKSSRLPYYAARSDFGPKPLCQWRTRVVLGVQGSASPKPK